MNQIAEGEAGTSIPDIEVRPTSLTISGEEAILLDIPHLRREGKVVVAHDGRAFILTIVPWVDTDGDFSRLENLDSTVIESCRF